MGRNYVTNFMQQHKELLLQSHQDCILIYMAKHRAYCSTEDLKSSFKLYSKKKKVILFCVEQNSRLHDLVPYHYPMGKFSFRI